MRRETAEIMALRVLAWFADDADRLAHFLNATGASPEDLANRAQDIEFLGHVLDFLLLDDDWIVAFCDTVGLAYASPSEARAALPGGDAVHWT